jgi:hypothetical protein
MNTVQVLKDNNQDFEWYPTTKEIIHMVVDDFKQRDRYSHSHNDSILDVGAGDGRVLKAFQEELKISTLYAVEKSTKLIELMDENIMVIGTEFQEQTFIDKKVSVVFSNPPYSDFSEWSIKLIKEANTKFLYLVIPERWSADPLIKQAIKSRNASFKVIGKTDFLNAERSARCKVDIVLIDLYAGTDAFDSWFDESFKISVTPEKLHKYEEDQAKREQLRNELTRNNLITDLVSFYNKDFEKLLGNYKAVELLDASILKELGVDVRSLKEGLKLKIEGLKNLYWNELFSNLSAITERLTSRFRDDLLKSLTARTNIDFTESNIYAVVIWVIKKSNTVLDDQIKDFYLTLTSKENVIPYKSNQHMVMDSWRYCRSEASNYVLDYRIIHKCYSCFGGYSFERLNGLGKAAHSFIGDILTIGKNLGFNASGSSFNFNWVPGGKNSFYLQNGELFVEIRPYKNGNVHMRFNQAFMKKLNVEAGRLNGWIRSPKEAAKEFDITEEEAASFYGKAFKFTDYRFLLGTGTEERPQAV